MNVCVRQSFTEHTMNRHVFVVDINHENRLNNYEHRHCVPHDVLAAVFLRTLHTFFGSTIFLVLHTDYTMLKYGHGLLKQRKKNELKIIVWSGRG